MLKYQLGIFEIFGIVSDDRINRYSERSRACVEQAGTF